MLPRHADTRVEFRPSLEGTDDGRHLDSLWAGPKHRKDAHAHRRHPRVSITTFSLRSDARSFRKARWSTSTTTMSACAMASGSGAVSKPLTAGALGSQTITWPIFRSRRVRAMYSAGDSRMSPTSRSEERRVGKE